MSSEVFAQIRELKQEGKFVEAWDCGFSVFQQEPNNSFLRTSLFWVCYAGIKSIQQTVLTRQGNIPNSAEQNIVNSWINCIAELNLPVPCDELDFRFFNLFKGCGHHYLAYIQMLTFYGPRLYRSDDLKPYKTNNGEYPSLLVRLARQTSKAWLQNHKDWDLELSSILNLLNYALEQALDKNKTWLQFDISKCLMSAGKHDEAREAAIVVLRKNMSESWAWGALADTYNEEDCEAAIACYSKGIVEAHEPPFCVPMYYGLAQLFAKKKHTDLASAAMCQLIEIYNSNGWNLKPEHEVLLQQPWFDASMSDTLDIHKVIKEHANQALKYATENLETAVGIVDAHHKSGKGFSIYIDLGKRYSARKGAFLGKGLPEIGSWLELKLANEGGNNEVLEAHKIIRQEHEKVSVVEGSLRLHPNGFGFIDDVFCAPYLVNGYKDGEYVNAIKILDNDPKKGKPSWKAIKIQTANSDVQLS